MEKEKLVLLATAVDILEEIREELRLRKDDGK